MVSCLRSNLWFRYKLMMRQRKCWNLNMLFFRCKHYHRQYLSCLITFLWRPPNPITIKQKNYYQLYLRSANQNCQFHVCCGVVRVCVCAFCQLWWECALLLCVELVPSAVRYLTWGCVGVFSVISVSVLLLVIFAILWRSAGLTNGVKGQHHLDNLKNKLFIILEENAWIVQS